MQETEVAAFYFLRKLVSTFGTCVQQCFMELSPMTSAVSAAGHPVEAWHGTSGFATCQAVKLWMTRVRARVRLARPRARLAFVIDVCSTHRAMEVLVRARRLKVAVIFVPAKMTWLLQPLDSHVFAVLKRRLRRSLILYRTNAVNPLLDMGSCMTLCGDAIQTTLARHNWSRVMLGSGLMQGPRSLRQSLLDMVAGLSMTPRPPSVEELAEVTACGLPHAQKLRTLLIDPWLHMPSENSGAEAAHPDVDVRDTHVPVEALRPMLRQHRPGSVANDMQRSAAVPMSAPRPVHYPRGRRLTPCVRNMVLPPPPPLAENTRMQTRSQTGPLLPGVLEQPSARFRRRPSQAASSTGGLPQPSGST